MWSRMGETGRRSPSAVSEVQTAELGYAGGQVEDGKARQKGDEKGGEEEGKERVAPPDCGNFRDSGLEVLATGP